MKITKQSDIETVRKGGALLAGILRGVTDKVAPGVTTDFLNTEAEKLIKKAGAVSSFLGYKPEWSPTPYPAVICTSVNDEVVHGIPSERVLEDGDIVGIDCAIHYEGLCVDAAVTVGVGRISELDEKLIRVTREALAQGIAAVKAGAHTGDIGSAVERYVKPYRYGVVRDLAGHGVGRTMHEEPTIVNFGEAGTGDLLEEGMLIAIEPMVNEGDWRVGVAPDGWGICTKDGKRSAHFEHTVLVTKNGCETLTQ